jgi:hypothetical protein
MTFTILSFSVESSGIALRSDDREGVDVTGPDITSIHCEGTKLYGLHMRLNLQCSCYWSLYSDTYFT